MINSALESKYSQSSKFSFNIDQKHKILFYSAVHIYKAIDSQLS